MVHFRRRRGDEYDLIFLFFWNIINMFRSYGDLHICRCKWSLPLLQHRSFEFFFYSKLKPETDLILTAANGSNITTFGSKNLSIDLNLRKKFSFSFLSFCRLFDSQLSLTNWTKVLSETTSVSLSYSIKDTVFITLPVRQNLAHEIYPKGDLLVLRPHRLSRLYPIKSKLIKHEFHKMINLGICRQSSSGVSYPLHITPKKDGLERQSCGEYRQLNAATIPGTDGYKTAVKIPLTLFEFLTILFGSRNGA